jgi:HAD superfamily 5'-nucleotidase-like hydrolase
MALNHSRRVFCNRTLNLRSIKAIGYDMDYTLIHYHVEEWERRAYDYLKLSLERLGWPVSNLVFDPKLIVRGLIIDTLKGNLVKANRFGFIKRGMHGTSLMEHESLRDEYSRTIVDLNERRWVFLNTLFSLSEGCMYAQLVDLLDRRMLPEGIGYTELYWKVRNTLNALHMDGRLKADVINDPARYIILEPEVPLALLDQKKAGKKLMLITNSEWSYTVPMMRYTFDQFLPQGMTWRELFDVVIVSAQKPEFFTMENPLFEVMTENGYLAPSVEGLRPGAAFYGGSARHVEKHLGLSGDEILYVGDHMFGDVKVTKAVLRWRTALILREIEDEVDAQQAFVRKQIELEKLMAAKELLEDEVCEVRLKLQRKEQSYGTLPQESLEELQKSLLTYKQKLEALDSQISPLAHAAAQLSNAFWGPLMRTGNDKSHLAFQLERYADIYMSRVSNFSYATPFAYFRSPRGSLPHDIVRA